MKKLKILIVDDEPNAQLLLTMMLEMIGHEILYASNGLEAVEIVKNNHDTDLILMDLMMPLMDGKTAIRNIREFNKDVIIITQTASHHSNERIKCFEAGANEFLNKPINSMELEEMILKYFENVE